MCAQAHGATQIGIGIAGLDAAIGIFPFGNQSDDRVSTVGCKLGAIGVFQACHVACKLNGGYLHAQANAEVGDFVRAGKMGCADFAFHAALAKTAGYQNRIKIGQLSRRFFVNRFRIDIRD